MLLGGLLLLACLGGAQSGSGLASPGIRIDVPLYSGSALDWSRTTQASPPAAMVFLNPSNGPGDSLNFTVRSLVRDAQVHGVEVLGYVPTTWADGIVSTSAAELEIQDYYSWYGVDGIAFDQVNDTCDLLPLTYYTLLYDYVKAQPGNDVVVLNPGTAVGECYAGVSDVIVTFEDSYASYIGYQASGWVRSYPSSHFINIVFDAQGASSMENAILLAASRNVGGVYVTDSGGEGQDPYASLPSYFGLEVSYVSSPSALGMQTLTLNGTPALETATRTASVAYKNNIPFDVTGSVYLIVRNSNDQSVSYSSAAIEVPPGGEATATLGIGNLPSGSYSAYVFAVGADGASMSGVAKIRFAT